MEFRFIFFFLNIDDANDDGEEEEEKVFHSFNGQKIFKEYSRAPFVIL